MTDFNRTMIERFGVNHAHMHLEAPNAVFDLRLARLCTYLDLQMIHRWARPRLPGRPSILDVGAGKGRMTRHFVKIAARCVAIEPYRDFHQALTANCQADNLTTHNLTLQDYARVAAERFDLVYLSGVFPYMTDDEVVEALVTARALLRPGGLVCIRDFGREAHAGRSAIGTEVKRTPQEVVRAAQQAGLTCLRWRRAYPVNIPEICYARWPNALTRWLWRLASAPAVFPLWGALAALNLPHRRECFVYYVLQPDV
jgi:SAM-dependent methyltransferase